MLGREALARAGHWTYLVEDRKSKSSILSTRRRTQPATLSWELPVKSAVAVGIGVTSRSATRHLLTSSEEAAAIGGESFRLSSQVLQPLFRSIGSSWAQLMLAACWHAGSEVSGSDHPFLAAASPFADNHLGKWRMASSKGAQACWGPCCPPQPVGGWYLAGQPAGAAASRQAMSRAACTWTDAPCWLPCSALGWQPRPRLQSRPLRQRRRMLTR